LEVTVHTSQQPSTCRASTPGSRYPLTSAFLASCSDASITLFYKTRNGAQVGDLFMSLIYTYSSFAATKGLTARELWRAAA
jgi:hypothetical protein